MTTPFDVQEICRQTFVRHVEYHDSVPSTNRLAAELLEPLLDAGPSLVLATNQTAGRGRGSNQWWSTSGALTFSIVMDAEATSLPVARRPLLSLLSGLAVRSAVADVVPQRTVSIKWPNDVLIGERKVCGILAEQHLVRQRCGIVIGIGLNVNNSLDPAPMELRQRATSLFDLTGEHQDLTSLLIAILNRLNVLRERVVRQPAAVLAEANAANILHLRRVQLQSGDRIVSGICRGIDEDGSLVLDVPGVGIQRCPGGSVVSWEQMPGT